MALTCTAAGTCGRRRPAVGRSWRRFLKTVARTVRTWLAYRRDRRILSQLTELELQDLGLTPSDRSWLARRRFWTE